MRKNVGMKTVSHVWSKRKKKRKREESPGGLSHVFVMDTTASPNISIFGLWILLFGNIFHIVVSYGWGDYEALTDIRKR